MIAACTEVQAWFLTIYVPKHITQETFNKKGEKNNDFAENKKDII